MFDGIIQDKIAPEIVDSKVDLNDIPKFNSTPIDVPSYPDAGVQEVNVGQNMQNYFSKPTREAQLNPTPFDWDKERFGMFTEGPHFKTYGADPEAGVPFNEEKFAAVQTGWDETKRMIGGFGAGLVHGFWDQLTSWKNIGNVFSDPTLQEAFKQDQLEELNRKQQEFDNSWHIFQGDDPTWYSSIAKGVQGAGHFIGALAEIAAETVAIQALVAGTLGAAAPLEGVEGARIGTALGETTKTGAAVIPDLVEQTAKLSNSINNERVLGKMWKNLGLYTEKAGKYIPGVGNTIGYAGELIQGGKGVSAMATMGRGVLAVTNDIRSINHAVAFASGNAAATYQQSVNDQVEKYKKANNGSEPGYADLQGMKDNALKASKVDGAINAYAMLMLEKVAFGNILNSRSTLQEAIQASGRDVFDRIGIKPRSVEGAMDAPLYVKQQAKWYDFRANYWELGKHTLAKGAEFGVFGNVMGAIDKGVKSYFDAKYDNKDISGLDAIRQGIGSQFSKEGAGTFISGFLQGALVLGLGGAAVKGIGKWAEAKASGIDKQIDRLQQSADATMRAQTFVDNVNALWKDPLNPIKETVHDMVLQSSLSNAAKDALAGNNRKIYQDTKDDATRIFLLKLIKNGLGDMWVNRALEQARNSSQDELCKMMGVESTPENYKAIQGEIQELPTRLNDLRRMSKEVDKNMPNYFNPWAKDPETGKRLYEDGSEQFNVQYNNWKIHQIAKDYVVTMHDDAVQLLKRQGDMLNGNRKTGSTGILDMPFAKDLDFNSVFTISSTELLDKHIGMYDELLNISPDNKEAQLGKEVTQKYQERLKQYLDEYAAILNEGSTPDREQKIEQLDEKHKEELTKALHTYLENSLITRNLKGKVVDKKAPPQMNEVRDAMDKLMDYYKLQVEHGRVLHMVNLVMDPSIIKQFQMSFIKEGAKRQAEAEQPETATEGEPTGTPPSPKPKPKYQEAEIVTDEPQPTGTKPVDKGHIAGVIYGIKSYLEKNNGTVSESDGKGGVIQKKVDIGDLELELDRLESKLKKNGTITDIDIANTLFRVLPVNELLMLKDAIKGNPQGVIDEIRQQLSSIPKPEVNTDTIRDEVKQWAKDYPNGILSPEGEQYMKDNKQLETVIAGAKGIYGGDELSDKEVDAIIDNHFDKNTPALNFKHLPDSPEVIKNAEGKYIITDEENGQVGKPYDSIRDANEALKKMYPIYDVQGRQLQKGQYLYNDNGEKFLLKDRNEIAPTTGKQIPVKVTDEQLLQYHDKKPDAAPGKPVMPDAKYRLADINEITEVRVPGMTEAEKATNRPLVDAILRTIPKDELSDQVTIQVTIGPKAGQVNTNNSLVNGNPYLTLNRDAWTITVHRKGKEQPMLYIQSPNKYSFTNPFTGEEGLSVPAKEWFEYVYNLNGRPLDVVYDQWKANYDKSQQLAEVIDQILKNNGVVTGAKLDRVVTITPLKGEYDYIPRSESDRWPSVQQTIDAGNEFLAVVDQRTGDTVYGTIAEGTQMPKEPNQLGGYVGLVKLPNGDTHWVQMVPPEYTDMAAGTLDTFVAENITKASADIKSLRDEGKLDEALALAKLTTEKLKTLFITQAPKRAKTDIGDTVVSFNFNMGKNGALNVGYNISTLTETGWVDDNKHHIAINAGVGIDKAATGEQFINSLQTKTNNYLKKHNIAPVEIKPSNVRVSYNRDAQGKLSDDVVKASKITTSTGIVKNITLNYTVDKSALYQKDVPTDVQPVTIEPTLTPQAQIVDLGYIPEEQKAQELIDKYGDDGEALWDDTVNSASKLVSQDNSFTADDIVSIHEFVQDIVDKLPQNLVSVVDNLVPAMVNGHMQVGEFITYLDEVGNVKGVIRTSPEAIGKYHEAGHAIFRMLLSPEQQRILLDEAHKINPIIQKEWKKFQDSYGDKATEDLFQEEWIMDKFDKWKKNHKTAVPGTIRAWFEKLWNFIKELFHRITGNQIEATFYKYNRGGFKHAKLQENEFTTSPNSSAAKLIEIGEQTYTGPDGKQVTVAKTLDPETGNKLASTITAIYSMERLTSTKSGEALINEILDKQRDTLQPKQDRYKEMFLNKYKADKVQALAWKDRLTELHSIYNNPKSRGSIIEAVNDKLKLLGYTKGLYDDKITKAENEVGIRTSFDDTADMKSGYDELQPDIKEYINTTTYDGVDEFGNQTPVAVDGQKVYNGMLQLLKNIPDINKMVDTLNNLLYTSNSGDAGAVVRKLFSDTGFTKQGDTWSISKNPQLFIQFINGFRQASIGHVFVEAGTNTGSIGATTRSYEANIQNAAKNKTDVWQDGFNAMYQTGYESATAKKTYAKDHLKPLIELRDLISSTEHRFNDDNSFVNKCQQLSNDIKEQLGIALQPLTIQYSIAHNKVDKSPLMLTLVNTYTHKPIDPADITGIQGVMVSGKNPFSVEEGALNRLKDIADADVPFDDSADSTNYLNAEGKNIYGFQKYNYITEKTIKLNSGEEIEKLRNNPDTELCHFLDDTKWLNWDKQVSVVDGVALRYHDINGEEIDAPAYMDVNKAEGSVMKNFNTRELSYYTFSIYNTPVKSGDVYGTNVIPAVISDKNSLYMVNAPVIQSVYVKGKDLKVSEGALDKLYNIVQEEIARIQRVQKEIEELPENERVLDWHTGKLNGLKFDRARLILGDIINADGTMPEEMPKQYPIRAQIEKYFLSQVDKYIDNDLTRQGLIEKVGDQYVNKMLPEYLWKGIAGTKGDALNIVADNFRHNVAQIYISNYINADGYTHLLSPNGIGTKRLSFWNADGDGLAKPNMIAPELGIDKPLTEVHIATLKEPKDETGFDHADSQGWITEKGMRNLHWGWGTLSLKRAQTLDKITIGKRLSNEEVFGKDGILRAGAMLNPLKPVYYDGYTGIKLSVHMLSKNQVMVKGSNGRYIPDIRRQTLYKIWKGMNDHETANDSVAMVFPESASKLQTKNVVPSVDALNNSHFIPTDANYWRKQLENPTNKDTMTKPTQPVWQILAEQNDDTEVHGVKISAIKQQYGHVVAERLQQNWNNALNGLFTIAGDRPMDIATNPDLDTVTPVLGKFFDNMKEMLQATGSNEQTLGFMETRGGEPIYAGAMDFPATSEKFVQQVLNYFGKVMNEQVPGITATKISPYGYDILREIHEVDANGSPIPGKWRVIPDSEYEANPEAFAHAITYTDAKARTHIGLKKGDIIIDHLRANVPQYKDGIHTGINYSEYLVPIHDMYDDDGSQDSPIAMGYRNDIPYAAGNNGNTYLRVGTLPAELGSIEVNPSAQSRAGGKDHDLDKDYLQKYSTYVSGGKLVKYGIATTDQGRYGEYIQYQEDHNRNLRATVKRLYDSDPNLKELVNDVITSQKYIHDELIQQLIDTNRLMSHDIDEGELTTNVGIVDSGEKYIYGNDEVGYREATRKNVSNVLLQHKNYDALYMSAKKELTKAFKESSDELTDLYKAVTHIKNILFMRAMQENKLPTTIEEFIQRGGDMLNVGVLNNRELDAKIALAGNSHVAGGDDPLNLEPTSTDLLGDLVKPGVANGFYDIFNRRLNEDTELSDTDKKNIQDLLDSFGKSDVNINEMSGQSRTHSDISAGKGSVGIAANGVPVLSFTIQHKLDVPAGTGITFNGVDHNKLYDLTTTNGVRKFSVMMTYINSATDNAKLDGLLAKLGLTREALSDAMSMNNAGINIDDAVLYMLQPVVKKYYNDIAYLRGTLKSFDEAKQSKQKVLELAIDNLVKSGAKQTAMDRQKLENNIVEPDKDTELTALLDIQKAQKLGTSLFNLSRVLTLASNPPISWEDVDNIQISIGELQKDAPQIYKALTETDAISKRYIQMLNQIEHLSPLLFIKRSELFKRIRGMQDKNLKKPKPSESGMLMKQRDDDLVSYLSIAALKYQYLQKGVGSSLSMSNSLIYDVIPGEKITDVAQKLKGLKGKKANYFINQFVRVVKKNGLSLLDSNNFAKLPNDRQIQLRDSLMYLINDPATREDGMKLFNYLLVKDGGQFKKGSFIKFVAPAVFKDLLDNTSKVKKALALKEYSDADAIELFGKDWTSVANEYMKSITSHVDNKHNLHYIRIDLQSGNKPVYHSGNEIHIDLFRGIDSKKGWTTEHQAQLDSNKDEIQSVGLSTIQVPSGKKGKKGKPQMVTHVQLPMTIRSGDQVYELVDNPIKKGQDISTGTTAIYRPTDTIGARNTFKAAGALFGQVPYTSQVTKGILPTKETVTKLPYSPLSEVKLQKQEVQSVQQVPQGSQEIIKTLASKHQIYVVNEGGRNVAYKANGELYPVPQGMTPKQLLESLEEPQDMEPDYDLSEGLDEDTIMELVQKRSQNTMKSQQNVVSSRPMQQDLFSQQTDGNQQVIPIVQNLAEHTNYSGDASGGDKTWATIGKEKGLCKQVNYMASHMDNLSSEQRAEVEAAYQQAAKDLGRPVMAATTYAGKLVRRDYLQAKAGDAIYAVSTIVQPGETNKKGYKVKSKGESVDGGTGYAVQMAINMGKPVHVYDQEKQQWYQWSSTVGKFIAEETPILTQKYTGIGTREINEAGKQAIRDVYEKTLGQSAQPVVSSQQMNTRMDIIPLTNNFSRQSVMADPTHLYLFTDNANRSSGSNRIASDTTYAKRYGQGTYPGMTQAVIRGLENAYPITTMVDDKRTQWTDDKFNEYKKIIDSEIEHIKEAMASGQYKGIKFAAQMPFGKGQISNMRQSAPKIWQYMTDKLKEIGIDNTGEKPTVNIPTDEEVAQKLKDCNIR